MQAKVKAAQKMVFDLGMQHLPQASSQPTTQDSMRLIAAAQAIASSIAQQVRPRLSSGVCKAVPALAPSLLPKLGELACL